MAKLIIGNWKMNGSQSLISTMIETLTSQIELNTTEVKVAICPPFPYIGFFKKAADQKAIDVGAQDVYTEEAGAYTGEVSAGMLADWRVQFGIVGHSERRAYFGESDETVNKKAKLLLTKNITPVICIGESLEQREKGEHEATVVQQLVADLADMSADDISRCVIAYEPIWAIGTGKTATEEQANQMHKVIREKLTELATPEIAKSVPILYGGSVNAKNSGTLLAQSDIDGALVGGASLKPDDFSQIIQSCL